MKTIRRIQICQRYPIPEPLINAPKDFDLFVDSLLMAGYDSDQICAEADERPELDVPMQSAESEEEFDFRSSVSSDEEADIVNELVVDKDKEKKKKRKVKRAPTVLLPTKG